MVMTFGTCAELKCGAEVSWGKPGMYIRSLDASVNLGGSPECVITVSHVLSASLLCLMS
jgi:hypothetical protein